MNKVTLVGNVGKEVIMRTFENGKLASFTLATKETYTNRKNEEVVSTTWHNLVAFGKVADVCQRMVAKGKLISVEGKINHRSYKINEDKVMYVSEIQVYKITEVVKNNKE
ncbi:single-stranded DNA-binding protein [Runella sp.]|jgi:single-strand DNA-binding protein|uniref:single-stranded DNA-binding protein n=1 Tax=Runella sp. TaxID=1960881 RepID=UPI00261B0CFD|nr:single-stranded DNA-binding protein [Runella sp.]